MVLGQSGNRPRTQTKVRGYKREQSVPNVCCLIAFADNHIARGLKLADMIVLIV